MAWGQQIVGMAWGSTQPCVPAARRRPARARAGRRRRPAPGWTPACEPILARLCQTTAARPLRRGPLARPGTPTPAPGRQQHRSVLGSLSAGCQSPYVHDNGHALAYHCSMALHLHAAAPWQGEAVCQDGRCCVTTHCSDADTIVSCLVWLGHSLHRRQMPAGSD